jgi:hypothetical protein
MSSILDMQVYALLGRLGAEREESCRRLLEDARAQAREMLEEARGRARRRVRAAVREKRDRVAEHCRRVRVELETQRRNREFACLGAALQAGLARLPGAMEARWAEPAARRRWCESALGGAATVLGRGGWRVEHAPGLADGEAAQLASLAARLGGEDCTLVEDHGIRAGLRVLRDGAIYDATLSGLTAQRERLESALLAEITALTGGEVAQ